MLGCVMRWIASSLATGMLVKLTTLIFQMASLSWYCKHSQMHVFCTKQIALPLPCCSIVALDHKLALCFQSSPGNAGLNRSLLVARFANKQGTRPMMQPGAPAGGISPGCVFSGGGVDGGLWGSGGALAGVSQHRSWLFTYSLLYLPMLIRPRQPTHPIRALSHVH